jgi:hypothetical protein
MELHEARPPDYRLVALHLVGEAIPGAILIAQLAAAEAGDAAVLEYLRRVRTAGPWRPLVLHVHEDEATPSHLPGVLAATGARAVVPNAAPDADLLRTALVDPAGWRLHLRAWVDVCCPELPARGRAVLRAVLAGAPQVSEAVRPLGSRQVNYWLNHAGIGPQRRATRLLRVLQTLQSLWAAPDQTIAEAAASGPTPWSEPGAFSTACIELIGLRPRQLKGILTWEWVLWEAIQRYRNEKNAGIGR